MLLLKKIYKICIKFHQILSLRRKIHIEWRNGNTYPIYCSYSACWCWPYLLCPIITMPTARYVWRTMCIPIVAISTTTMRKSIIMVVKIRDASLRISFNNFPRTTNTNRTLSMFNLLSIYYLIYQFYSRSKIQRTILITAIENRYMTHAFCLPKGFVRLLVYNTLA